MNTLLCYWLPVILWAGVIFLFSTEAFSSPQTSRLLGPLLSYLFPGISTEQIQGAQFLIRKLGHWSEYLVLSLLFARAIRKHFSNQRGRLWPLWTVLFVMVYAASDEIHQSLVPGRSASYLDVMIDSFGGLCGTLWIYWRDLKALTRKTHLGLDRRTRGHAAKKS